MSEIGNHLKHQAQRPVFRYFASGLMTNVAAYVFFSVFLILFGANLYLVALFTTHIFNVLLSYTIHSLFSFRSNLSKSKLLRYVFLSTSQLLLFAVLLTFLVEAANLSAYLAQALIMLGSTPIVYLMNRDKIFT